MALTTSYLTSVKNFESIMNSILNAKAPECVLRSKTTTNPVI
jgi:hypothetical protein